jgi:hypothetical protein
MSFPRRSFVDIQGGFRIRLDWPNEIEMVLHTRRRLFSFYLVEKSTSRMERANCRANAHLSALLIGHLREVVDNSRILSLSRQKRRLSKALDHFEPLLWLWLDFWKLVYSISLRVLGLKLQHQPQGSWNAVTASASELLEFVNYVDQFCKFIEHRDVACFLKTIWFTSNVGCTGENSRWLPRRVENGQMELFEFG